MEQRISGGAVGSGISDIQARRFISRGVKIYFFNCYIGR